jgi:prepilin-type N-terminal cleavage/methylation domain-containing protein
MNMRKTRQSGFTLIELMAVVAFITLVSGSIFLMLNTATQRYQTESEVLDSFQNARLAIDQMTRDIHGAGFPPANVGWKFAPGTTATAFAFAWDPGYVASTPCTVGGTCTTPSATDLIIEGNISPSTGAGVQWIRYTLTGTTLMRGVAPKTPATDPVAATPAGVMFPVVENVINDANTPLFTYECNNGATPPTPVTCAGAPAPNNTAAYIRQVGITLVVRSAQPDPQTGQYRTVSLHSQALIVNPTQ